MKYALILLFAMLLGLFKLFYNSKDRNWFYNYLRGSFLAFIIWIWIIILFVLFKHLLK